MFLSFSPFRSQKSKGREVDKNVGKASKKEEKITVERFSLPQETPIGPVSLMNDAESIGVERKRRGNGRGEKVC